MRVRVYVEGGGDAGSTKAACREGFRRLFEKLNLDAMPKLVASGGRTKAFDNFSDALRSHLGEMILLLVDSETVVKTAVWAHLNARDGWNRPAKASEEQAHLMVRCMEAWLLADKEALQAFYARGFAVNALPGARDVESIPKGVVMSSLRRASKRSQKGEYHKTRHAYALLQLVDPAKVRSASRHAARFFDVLRRETAR